MRRPINWSGPPLALQIMALLLGVLIVAQLATLVLTLLLPPAPKPQYNLDDVAAMLVGEAAGREGAKTLQRQVQAGPPDIGGPGWLLAERSRQDLARLVGAAPADVTLAFYTPLPFAGTMAQRPYAMADDGPVAPLDGMRAGAVRPVALLLQDLAPPPGGGAMPGAPPFSRPPGAEGRMPPARDTLPPGIELGGRHGRRGEERGPAGGRADTSARVGTADPLIRFEQAQVSRDYIPGDGGVAVPGLLRGGEAGAVAQTPNLRLQGAEAAQVPLPPQMLPGFNPRGALPDRALLLPSPLIVPAPARSDPAPLVQAPSSPPIRPQLQPAAPPPSASPQLALPAPAPLAVPTNPPVSARDIAPLPSGPPIRIEPARRGLFGLAPAPFVVGDFVAALRLRDGRWAVVRPAPEPFPNAWQRRVLLWFAISLALVGPFGWLFARRLVKPLERFAGAAEQLGRDPKAVIDALDGPAEIGRAARAFNLMQTRLRTFVDDRTAMVGAISHDLRTPLTRMRFRIEDVDAEEVREGLLEEVDDMEAMIAEVIAFIRDATTPGLRERCDLSALVEDSVEDARLVGADVTIERADPALVEVDVLGFRRLLDNLLENAVKYGARAKVRLRIEAESAIAEVIDEGPGLPEDEIERVFEPFYRSEAARASTKAGSGLGLAVCRSIARAHGGDVELANTGAGLAARIRVPLAYGAAAG